MKSCIQLCWSSPRNAAPPLSGPAYASPADLQRLVAVTAVAERWDDGLATAAAMTVSDTSNAATQAITTLLFMNLPPLTGVPLQTTPPPFRLAQLGQGEGL